jgi:outer membrane protein assembly factor BamB
MDLARASSPLGFPGNNPSPSMNEAASEGDGGSVVPLPPEIWPGESALPSHNPVFVSTVPLSEWSRQFARDGVPEDFFSGVVTASGRIFVASRSGHLEALAASSGKSLWHVRLEAPVNTPMILSKKTLYVVSSTPSITLGHLLFYTRTRHLLRGDGSERIWALSQRSGRVIWSKGLPGAVLGSPLLEPHTIALATGSGHLVFLSRQDGHMVVDLPVSEGSFGWASPLDRPDAIYLAQENPPMIDRVGKSPLKTDWRLALSNTRTYDRFFIGGPVSTSAGIAGVFRERGTGRMILVSIDGVTGKILWTRSLSETSPETPEEMVSMVSSDGILYVPVPEKGDLFAVSERGELLWKTHVGDHPHTGGTAVGRLLFLPLPSGHIAALDRMNGEILHVWAGKAPLPPRSLPVIGSMIFLSDRSGDVRAMDMSSLGEKADLLSRTPFLEPRKTSGDVVRGMPDE